MKNLISGLALFTALSFSACTKEQQAGTDQLTGTWQWIRTDGGFANHIHQTPASTGTQVELRLNTDSSYTRYTNGIPTGQGSYRLEQRKCIHDHLSKPVLVFNGNSSQSLMIERLDSDTLELSDEAFDGVGHQYTRKF